MRQAEVVGIRASLVCCVPILDLVGRYLLAGVLLRRLITVTATGHMLMVIQKI